MVLVSYPKRVIHGVICGEWRVMGCAEGNKKAGRYPLAR